jgi:PAS domain S-box-containing protein
MKSGKSKLNYEEPQTTPDGSTIWLRTSKVPLHDVDGSVSAVLGMYEDITERKQVEQALSDSEARYSAVVTQAKDGVVIIQDNILQFVNQAMADMVGYTPAEIENTPIINYIAPESRTLIVDRIKARLAGQEVPSVYEAKLQRKDGTIFDAELSAGLIEYRGKPADVGMIRDITERKKSEEIIRESEERFRRFTEATAEGLVFHEQGRIIDANPAALVMFGLSNSAEFVGKNLLEFLVPESHEMVLKQMQLETVSPYEVRCIRKNGSTFPVETSTRTYKFGDRTIRATSVRDITERKQAEQALRESQQLLQTVMDNIPQSIFWKDSNLTYLGCNSAFAADAGLASPSDAIGKTDWDMPWKEQAELYRADDSLVMKSGTPKLNYEEPQTTPDGSVIWLRTSKVPLRDMDGKVSAVLGMYEDVTERKQAEQALRESQQLLQTVMDNIPQSIFWKDSNLTYLGCNSAFAADANLASPGDVIGKTDWDMPWKEQAELYRGDDSLVMKSGTPKLNYEEPQTTADGSTIWLRTSKVPLHDVDGSVYAVLGMYEDITERKNLEQQIQTAFERRGRQVQLSTQVSQSIAAASSLEELYQRVVTQVKEQFGYYHTQILRYDAAQDAVVLVTGYGETGAKMLAAGHRLPMGAGLIGTAAASGQTVLRPALENDPDWHSNPLLPNTKGEIAVPIKLGDNILGVLDVQSDVIGALGADDQLLLEGLCGQIATVIESTRLRQEMAERLEEINRLYKAMSHEGWQTYRERADIPKSFMFDQGGLKQATDTGLTEELFAKVPLTVPGGEVIGTLAVADDPQHPISSEDQTFIQQISEQVALALESARLFEQTQGALSEAARKASELETVAEVSATTSTALDPDKLLQSVVDLTKDRFDLYHAHIYLADDKWQVLLIAAGAGEVGRRMVADEHTIPMDAEKSLVARAVRERQAVIVNDVRSSPDFLANPLLPETRSEMAVPMIVGDTVLGVFDVQSDRVDGFTKEDASIYTTLASQVAVALQNARLYEKQAATVAQLRELDSLKSSFLANMSHELRTPLNSILGFADVMLEELDGPLTELMDNDLRLIQKNGQHLLHLINDVLDMAKIDAGRMNLHPEQFNLQELIEDVFSITSSLANEKSLALTIEEDSNPDVEIFADRTRIQQVMINLVNNAIKFTPAGSVTIHVAHQDEKVNIRVSDTGIGIPANHLDRIFQEFAQVDTSTTRKAGGTGLGLPISRRLIEMHGGRLWAESSGMPGEGSTFHIELPVKAKITEPVEKVEK